MAGSVTQSRYEQDGNGESYSAAADKERPPGALDKEPRQANKQGLKWMSLIVVTILTLVSS